MSDDQDIKEPIEEQEQSVADIEITDQEETQPGSEESEVSEAISPEEQIAELESKAAEYLDGWQRARAELQNVKKRTDRERERLQEDLRGNLALSLLPVVDDFDLAIGNLPEELADHEWVNGILLIHKKLVGQLSEMGVVEIESEGQPFDPTLHEAVAQIESEEHESDTVANVLRKGYRIDDRVLRAALVHVAH